MKHIGFSAHRLLAKSGNPREVAFAGQWKIEQGSGGGIPLLDHLIPNATLRDAMVAATIVQWLGSNVGMCFLRDVIEKFPEVREWIIKAAK